MLHKGGDKSQTAVCQAVKERQGIQAEGTVYTKAQRGESTRQAQVRDDETGVLDRAPGT